MFHIKLAAGALALFTLFSTTVPALAVDQTPTAGNLASSTLVVAAPATLSTEEADALQFMREEEKLAHDVYMTLYAEWGLRVFNNIAASEQKHTDAVATLLSRYNVSDPTAGNALGTFTDPALQALYDQLVAQGSLSLADALKVGAAIEEIDIVDLEERMAATDKTDILAVYGNLLAGSENHLRAFTSTLERQTGETYVPQYMDPAAYDAVVGSAANGGQTYLPSVKR